MPLALCSKIELTDAFSDPQPTGVHARLVRPRHRGGWVAGDLSWTRLPMLRHSGYLDAHLRLAQALYATYQASTPGRISSYSHLYGDVKSFPISAFDSPQLWPLLDEASRIGLKLVAAAGWALHFCPTPPPSCLWTSQPVWTSQLSRTSEPTGRRI